MVIGKSRRFWFIALSLALLAACVAVWAWGDAPPFRFARGAKLHWVEVTDGRATVHYLLPWSDRELEEIVHEARAEVLGKWASTPAPDFLSYRTLDFQRHRPGQPSFEWTTDRAEWYVGAYRDDAVPGNLSAARPPMLISERRASPLDTLRAWVYGLKR